MPDIDMEFHFQGYHKIPSKCRLRIWTYGTTSTSAIVLLENVPDGGTSITNRAAEVATKVLMEVLRPKLGVNYGRTTWIEHYPRRPFSTIEESFSLVTYDWVIGRGNWEHALNPDWKYIDRAWVETLVREEV